MAFKHKETANAYARKWAMAKRAQSRIKGLCGICPHVVEKSAMGIL